MAKNRNLNGAKKNKKDEFYTKIETIENELKHYKDHFKGKVVFCNCDDPEESNFWKYFQLNFEFLGLKKLISTHFDDEKPSYKLELVGDVNGDGKVTKKDIIKTPLKQNGDFRSPECIEILQEADIIVTNPPFSLFREYVAQLVEYNKKFIILGNNNAVKYKEIFPLIKNNYLWLGYASNITVEFKVPDGYEFSREDDNGKYGKVPAISWFTNLETKKRTEDLLLFRTYNEKDYPKYDNYDAINIDKVKDIPMDYYGVIGVPITYLSYYNPEQFEIIGELNHGCDNEYDYGKPILNKKELFPRILIKRKQNNADNT